MARAEPFEVRGFHCSPSRQDPYAWFVLPSHADLERDASGRPLLTMIDLGSSGSLMFTAQWPLSSADVDVLRGEIATVTGLDARRVRISFAPVDSVRCEALIADEAGRDRVIATSGTAGYPPYNAVFNLQLEGEDLAAARAAIAGHQNRLRVEYAGDLPSPITAAAQLRANARDLLPWLRAHLAEKSLRTLLEEAIESGRAEIRLDTSEGSDGPSAGLFERVLSEAERMLPRWLDGYETGELRIDVTAEGFVNQPVRAGVDIGGVVAAGREQA